MKLTESGLTFIKNFEGLRLKAYQDIAGIWTIGYGSTRHSDGQPIKSGDRLISIKEADRLLDATLNWYVDAVNQQVKVPLNQNQFNALVSFAYNVGTGALQKSTLLHKLNQSDYQGAADQLLAWNKVTDPRSEQKVVSKTLSNRRLQERSLFLKSIHYDNV
ncbi:lysozyme [Mucilaginibacter sp.]|uniref:lysozyme n=1 Tax=Mucilaginibacter sp. TaxID=1882438 RepID=UPI0035BBB04A